MSSYEKIFLAVGVVLAHGFLIHVWLYPSSSDAVGYVLAARDIAANGLFSKFYGSHARTYGYPAFLVAIDGLSNLSRLPFQIVLLEVQLLLYVGAALLVRRELMERYPNAARILFCGLLANYYAMIYASESLSESLSLTFTLLVATCWLRMVQRRNAKTMLVLGSFVVGCAVMIRPANLFLLAAWLVCCGLMWKRERVQASRVLVGTLAMLCAMALPAVPQMINNATYYGHPTPFVAYDLGSLQQVWGTKYLKYATAMPPVPQASVFYNNPLFDGTSIDVQRPWEWYFRYPVRGLVTLTLHVFNLTDQDLTFTYSRDLDPWYRLPLGVVNHTVIALGLVGFVLLALRVRAGANRVLETETFVALTVLLVANVAIYSLVAVEMRFGLTLLLAMFPLAGYVVLRGIAAKSKVRLAVAAFVVAYVIGAMLLSEWVRNQSPLIREAIAAKRAVEARPVFTCPTSFNFSSQPRGEGWSVPEHDESGFSMWMAADRAWISLPVGCRGPVHVRLSIAGYMAEDIVDGLTLKVDGSDVLLTRGVGPDGRLQLNGNGPTLSGHRLVRIELTVPRTVVPQGGDRTLAVMFSKLLIEPMNKEIVN